MSPKREPYPCEIRKKIKFKTRDRANKAARKLLKRYGWILYTYLCPDCGWWHFTSDEQKGVKGSEPDMSIEEAERLVCEFLHVSLKQLRAMSRLELYRRLVGDDS